jgi:hypothetical protein
LESIEILALIFAVVILFKVTLIIVSPKNWLKLVHTAHKEIGILFVAEIILAIVVFYFLLKELTFVQIMACLLLGDLLVIMAFTMHFHQIIPLTTKLLKEKRMHRSWIPILIWIALAIWVFVELFIF